VETQIEDLTNQANFKPDRPGFIEDPFTCSITHLMHKPFQMIIPKAQVPGVQADEWLFIIGIEEIG
jgi:hypothetical protein